MHLSHWRGKSLGFLDGLIRLCRTLEYFDKRGDRGLREHLVMRLTRILGRLVVLEIIRTLRVRLNFEVFAANSVSEMS